MKRAKQRSLTGGAQFDRRIMGFFAVFVAVAGSLGFAMTQAAIADVGTGPALTAGPTKVVATIHRKSPNYAVMKADGAIYTAGLLYGEGFTITDRTASAWQLKDARSGQLFGIYETESGVAPAQTTRVHTYINPNLPNGTYAGAAVLLFKSGGAWHDGPIISYSITLKN